MPARPPLRRVSAGWQAVPLKSLSIPMFAAEAQGTQTQGLQLACTLPSVQEPISAVQSEKPGLAF